MRVAECAAWRRVVEIDAVAGLGRVDAGGYAAVVFTALISIVFSVVVVSIVCLAAVRLVVAIVAVRASRSTPCIIVLAVAL